MITLEEACRRYRMSEEEFFAWRRAFENHGILGLRAACVPRPRQACCSRQPDQASGDTSPTLYQDTSAKI
jgi:transposase-like protein